MKLFIGLLKVVLVINNKLMLRLDKISQKDSSVNHNLHELFNFSESIHFKKNGL